MTMLQHSVIESGGYNIDRSLRFRGSASAYLNRTPASAGNRKTWTWSGWVKLGTLGTRRFLFSGGAGTTDTTTNSIEIGDQDKLRVQGGSTVFLITTQVFRDPSAWYHVAVAFDSTQATASNRIKVYVNGSQVTAFDTDNRSSVTQNADFGVNQAQLHCLGSTSYSGSAGLYFDGYLAEVNFIDGQALTPSSFGQFDPVTGVWQPKKYTGTYGTNGFYLDFKDNTSATTLAYDKSGNDNNWTANNISTTAGATYDSMTDVPTLTSATAANYCVLNGAFNLNGGTLGEGNLWVTSVNSTVPRGTIGVASGQYYFEVESISNGGYGQVAIGIANEAGTLYIRWSGTGGDAGYTTYGIYAVAFDASAGKVWLRDYTGAWVGSGDPISGTNPTFTFASGTTLFPLCGISRTSGSGNAAIGRWNFGQRPFSYTPPTGFKALNTFNLPDPTIKKPNQYMDATLWTGDGNATRTITTSPNFTPDLYWIKNRTNGFSNLLYDRVRGAGENADLSSNTTSAEGDNNTNATYGYVSSFTSDGLAVVKGSDANGYTNGSGNSYVAWCWKKGATPGFDIVTYTGTGANQAINHSLGVAPKMMIMKDRTSGSRTTDQWPVYHSGAQISGADQVLYLNSTAARATASVVFNNTTPTSTQFTVGTWGGINYSGDAYVAYLFAEIPGFSKFGSYTGNGSADGPFVYCGFRPKYVMVKCSSTTANWNVIDTSRNQYNVSNSGLFPGDSYAEQTGTTSGYVMEDILSNGFKLRMDTSSINANGATYIYAAFAENPMKYALAR